MATHTAELQAVGKAYLEGRDGQRRVVLDGADLTVNAGETVVIRGPSGSGKTTVLNLLGGLDLPDRGKVLVGGFDLARATDDQRTLLRRRHIGFVFQFFNLIDGLTVAENLRFPLELLAGGGRLAESGRVAELLRAVGLWDRRDSFPDRLSGGERQRIAVLRALVHRPTLILADEPTGNLDPVTGDEVLDLLVSQVRDLGASLVLVTHSDTAAARGDRVFDVQSGRLEPRLF